MSEGSVLAEIEQSIGEVQYEETGEFPVERGYIWTTCASVENGNPLFWDDEVAAEITGGPIAPPTMLSVWFRPHHWAPGRTQQALPLQVHFDLKEKLDLPEAIMSDNTIVFHEPVRPGDVLRMRLTVLEVRPSQSKPDRGIVRTAWEVINQNDVVVMTSEGMGMFRKRPDVTGSAP